MYLQICDKRDLPHHSHNIEREAHKLFNRDCALELKPNGTLTILDLYMLNLGPLARLLPEKKGVEHLWNRVGNIGARDPCRVSRQLRIPHLLAETINRVETHFLLCLP